jgi:DNA processing protein
LETVAFPGSGLLEKNIYPRAHLNLAREIVENGGALISEFDDNFSATNWAFPQRNRLMVAISDAILVVETKEKSGTMITSRLTLDYNRDLLVPPGSVFDESCRGANELIKQGAYPITCGADIIEIFGLEKIENKKLFANSDFTKNEILIYEIISTPTKLEELILKTGLKINEINEALTLLELKDLVSIVDGKICQK